LEFAVDVRVSAALKANVAFLGVGRKRGGMPHRYNVVQILVDQPYPGRNRPSGALVDDAAGNGLARDLCRGRRGDGCGSAEKNSPGPIEVELSLVGHGI
jgi:hypothetical protein